jgi:predicted PurR-regulated permease PerM
LSSTGLERVRPNRKESRAVKPEDPRIDVLRPGRLVGSDGLARRVFEIVAIALAILTVAALLWYAVDVFLLVFAGILLAILLRAPSDWLSERTGLPGGWSLGVVMLALVAVLALLGWLMVPSLVDQFAELYESIPQSLDNLRQRLAQYDWGERLLDEERRARLLPDATAILGRATGAISATFGALGSAVIILFLGLYLAISPGVYANGFTRLLPPDKRQRARQVLAEIGHILRRWLVGRLLTMTVIGVLTFVGLWFLGIPLALVLAFLAALLSFIPYIGPIVALVPAVLVAFAEGPNQALFVLILYVGVQGVESYLLLPLVQQWTVDMPPALTIAAIVLLGVLFGGLGIALAAPLAAAGMVAVNMLYLEDFLGEKNGNE